MLCKELHRDFHYDAYTESTCDQEIMPDWLFCVRCGRPTGHISCNQNPVQLQVPHMEACRRSFTLSNRGHRSISIHLKNKKLAKGVNLIGRLLPSIMGDSSVEIMLELPPFSSADTDNIPIGTLVIESQDAERNIDDPWAPIGWRTEHIELQAHVLKPALFLIEEEALVFRRRINQRTLKVTNVGETNGRLRVLCPRGYACDQTHIILSPHESAELTISRLWTEVPQVPTKSTLQIQPSTDQQSLSISLYALNEPMTKRVPDAIVGIDFGTAYTSVVIREPLGFDPAADPLYFLSPPQAEPGTELRFPTRIWVDIADPKKMLIGNAATKHYKDNEGNGYLFREIKSLLRWEEADAAQQVVLSPLVRRDDAISLLRERWGSRWPLELIIAYLKQVRVLMVEKHLRQRFTLDPKELDIQYVFSLPVLDQGELSRRSEKQMRFCIAEAGFPMDAVEFAYEPACAALGLLSISIDAAKEDRNRVHTGMGAAGNAVEIENWPQIGSIKHPIQDGDHILVFDSGGGTTDIVLGQVHLDQDTQQVSLEVRSYLGVGTNAETFGGEYVTDIMRQALMNAQPELTEYCSGALGVSQLYMAVQSFSVDVYKRRSTIAQRNDKQLDTAKEELAFINDVEAHDYIDQVKRRLATYETVTLNPKNPNNTTVRPGILGSIVDAPMNSIGQALQERVFTDVQPQDIRYYICLGGNSALKPIVHHVATLLGDPEHRRHLAIPERGRMLAVAYGTVWVPDARIRNAVPYGVIVKINDDTWWDCPANTSQDSQPSPQRHTIQPKSSLQIRILAMFDDTPECVAGVTVANSNDNIEKHRLELSVHRGMVTIYDTVVPNPHESIDQSSNGTNHRVPEKRKILVHRL
ncbi:MAG: hypothetical protein ACOX44_16920 [Limnochordia bacterium]